MKASEIEKGGKYIAKVSGVLTTVRVDEIREVGWSRMNHYSGRLEYTDKVVYDVTNLKTGRRTTFKSAAKFRRAVTDKVKEAVEQILGKDLADSVTPMRVPCGCPEGECDKCLAERVANGKMY